VPPDLRAFLAHAKGVSPDAIEEMIQRTLAALRPVAHGRKVVITSGLVDWEAHFARCGSWEAWQRDVAQGIDYLTREPRYHTIVVPSPRVGKATAAIVEGFLYTGKPALLLLESGELSVITECVRVAERDWQQGWEVR
jgi:hypothetical protein